jgi:hypothetical protein
MQCVFYILAEKGTCGFERKIVFKQYTRYDENNKGDNNTSQKNILSYANLLLEKVERTHNKNSKEHTINKTEMLRFGQTTKNMLLPIGVEAMLITKKAT